MGNVCFFLIFSLISTIPALIAESDLTYEIPCGVSNERENFEERIINGTAAKPHEFPWIVSIQRLTNEEYEHYCGGSLIHSKFVLSAAHCVIDEDVGQLRIAAGKMNLKKNEDTEQYRFVKRILFNEFKNETNKNDIALIQVKEKFKLNQIAIAPICLPTKNQDYYEKRITAGWGVTKEGGNITEELMKVMLTNLNVTACKEMYLKQGYNGFLNHCQLCTLDLGKDSCQADSGGPLMCNPKNSNKLYICGIISWGVGCALDNFPAVYAQVLCYRNWIADTIKSYENK